VSSELELSESRPDDRASLEKLYAAAFPEEDLLPVVAGLLGDETRALSLVAIADGTLVGHAAFTMCSIGGRSEPVALLAPVAVLPGHQKSGIGTALIKTGLERLQAGGIVQVYVLGDPAYYGRFGFAACNAVAPPYPLPRAWTAAWQSVDLSEAARDLRGELSVPAPWQRPELWAP
jgi:putative acetyltransferase